MVPIHCITINDYCQGPNGQGPPYRDISVIMCGICVSESQTCQK